ncbi:MAG: tartrate dehydrogenase/decarboxylase/D-malate dehydrogenase [Rhodoferax sp.]|jgi:tartrate dehydrogenase/decarboxylase/D-malate dehydrogenase
MKTYKIACVSGDGIGKKVVPAGQTVLAALVVASNHFQFDFENFGWDGDWY